jgi:peptide/nickel transport system substrate-binding protein
MLIKLFPFFIAVCTATIEQESHAVDKQGLIYGESGRLDRFDPYTVHEASGQRLSELLFDSLIELNPSGEYEASLAKSWRIKDGGTEVEFELRGDVFWHDSNDKVTHKLTADDVVATIRILQSSGSEIPGSERFKSLESARANGKNRVSIRTNRALIDPLKAMLFKILPAHHLGATPSLKHSSQFTKNPIGTGPYRFVKSSDQGEILLSGNKRYFKGSPKINQIVMKTYADQNVMAQALMYNSLDLITYVSPTDLGEITGDSRLQLFPYDALSFSFLAMNTAKGVLKDKRVRQAICYAINRPEMLQAFFDGNGRVISGPFPPTSWAYNLDVKPYEFDKSRAKRLLMSSELFKQDNGILKTLSGKKVRLNFAVPLAGENEMIKKIVLALSSYLSAIGIEVELQFMDWIVWKNRVLKDHDYDLTIASWSFDDSINIESLFHSSSAKAWGNNFVMYRNEKVDSLLTEADSSNDFDKKRAIYHKLHAMLADEAPYAYLWTLTHHAAYSASLSGFRAEPFAFFKHILNWKLEKAL